MSNVINLTKKDFAKALERRTTVSTSVSVSPKDSQTAPIIFDNKSFVFNTPKLTNGIMLDTIVSGIILGVLYGRAPKTEMDYPTIIASTVTSLVFKTMRTISDNRARPVLVMQVIDDVLYVGFAEVPFDTNTKSIGYNQLCTDVYAIVIYQ